jgi:gas vesicle protein
MSDTHRQETEGSREQLANNVAWFFTGAVIGLTAALLYAPKSGKDTRRLITGKTQQGYDAVADTGKDIVDAGKDMFERGRKLVEDAAELFERGRKLVRG